MLDTFLLIILILLILFLIFWQSQNKSGHQDQTLNLLIKNMQTLAKELGAISSIGDEMKNFKQDFETFFNSPKLRGNLGEAVLKDLLEQVLPRENYAFQYKFKAGQTVDAIVKTDHGIIPIDAKFPLENFRKFSAATDEHQKELLYRLFERDVKKHIDDISTKYILPGEKTLDFALMYLPSESIYYETAVNSENLQTFAREKRVLLVSPNSFYSFLRVIMLGLEGKKIEEKAKSILEVLNALAKNTRDFGRQLSVLNRHVTNAKNSMDEVNHEFSSLEEQVTRIKLLK